VDAVLSADVGGGDAPIRHREHTAAVRAPS
jgi:hypothetical protein